MAKTLEQIFAENRSVADILADLRIKDVTVPAWSTLEKEYDPKKHPVMTDANYKDVQHPDGTLERMTRITIPLQKLASKRMTQLCFGLPVTRVYKPENDKEKIVAKLLEKILQKNRINSLNIDRGIILFSSCEFVTLWYAVKEKTFIYGEESLLKLRSKNYSPMKGDSLFPLFDENEDLIALSIEYTRQSGTVTTRYFDTFTKDKHYQWQNATVGGNEGWTESINEPIMLDKIPAIYCYRPTPIWEDSNNDVYEMEWTISRNGNYIRKNSKPLFVVYADEETETGAKQNDSLAVLQYPKGSNAGYVTWEQSTESIKLQIENLYKTFFTGLQLPDMSFDSMKTTPMSGEARKMMFIDAQMKVLEEQGRLLEAFDREINVVKGFMKVMFPNYKKEIDNLSVENVITPFMINDEKEKISNILTATGGAPVMSQKEGIQYLGYSTDADATLKQLNDEKAASAMNPTF